MQHVEKIKLWKSISNKNCGGINSGGGWVVDGSGGVSQPKYLKTHKLYSSWLFLCFHPRKLDAWWAKIKKKCFKFFIHLCTLTFICQVRKCPLSKSWANVKQSQCLPQAIGSRVLFLTLLKLEDFIHFVESKKSNFWICWCHFSTIFNQYFYYWHGLSCIKLSKNLPLNKAMMSCGV